MGNGGRQSKQCRRPKLLCRRDCTRLATARALTGRISNTNLPAQLGHGCSGRPTRQLLCPLLHICCSDPTLTLDLPLHDIHGKRVGSRSTPRQFGRSPRPHHSTLLLHQKAFLCTRASPASSRAVGTSAGPCCNRAYRLWRGPVDVQPRSNASRYNYRPQTTAPRRTEQPAFEQSPKPRHRRFLSWQAASSKQQAAGSKQHLEPPELSVPDTQSTADLSLGCPERRNTVDPGP
ncbi:hypothetical protein BCR34DRAFT_338552 [Clohesyomyces aquaticus]|uniref:Uncharacterized protein n=1 Tax=Clohesyomyces aquaticus TaxID=1231657 RepID=A0A1Y1ZKV7_9PLEO|nr:hypothetical protein BCR34DRAFT_338552 [Clohesyomyces aquaticus]